MRSGRILTSAEPGSEESSRGAVAWSGFLFLRLIPRLMRKVCLPKVALYNACLMQQLPDTTKGRMLVRSAQVLLDVALPVNWFVRRHMAVPTGAVGAAVSSSHFC